MHAGQIAYKEKTPRPASSAAARPAQPVCDLDRARRTMKE
jgi:hypothetical protein